ncbi:hypothetical protein GCM10009096_29910 [Parasphingorhabdus litoris]|uniref:Uncharacterized protein n=1 Tax=Parasphingorhabdus litoris TaxID=394733 RepID=A0ABN1AWH8_9SPHN|nr:hypothetical protein [Parasphingorhabdus litoris]
MTSAYSPEANLSETERYVLGSLNQAWPSASTMTPDVIESEDNGRNPALFVDTVQTLSDNGMILYEAFLTGAASGPRFLDTMITARGKAALQSTDIDA